MAEITARELAERLGISTAAVSFALNGKPGVSEQTRERVLAMAQKLGYARTKFAYGDPTKKTICFLVYVGQVIRRTENTTFSSLVLRGAETAAAAVGYQTVVRYLYADKPLEPQLKNILTGVHGIILLATDVTEDSMPDIERLILSAGEIPTVAVNNTLLADKVDCVLNDNRRGAKNAVRHLIERGCTRIGYLASRDRIDVFRQREQGMMEALQEAGLPLLDCLMVANSVAASEEIEAWTRAGKPLPDGVFADDDVLGTVAVRTLRRHGIDVPGRVAVIGFDDEPICEICEPQLSSVQVFAEEMGAWASQIICKRLERNSGHYDEPLLVISVSTPLCVRQSSAR